MSALTWEQRLCNVRQPPKITSGLDAMVDGFIGACRRRGGVLASLRADVEKIDAFGSQYAGLNDARLRERLAEFRETFRRQPRRAEAHVLEALAAIREASVRQTGLRPFPVQLMGALALHRGYLAEMATGEGKTLTAGLAAVLAGWTGRPCHLVTVNDYLAQRDAEWLRSFYEYCDLRVGFVTGEMPRAERARGHAADVTYTTSKELAADFLRDRLCLGELQHAGRRMIRAVWKANDPTRNDAVMRGLHTAIVDEADSVLIDEAVTPLIIAGSEGNERGDGVYHTAWSIASRFLPGVDYRVDLRYREIELLAAGHEKMDALSGELPGLWRAPSRRTELIKQTLTARELFLNGKQYVIEDGKVVIVDESTGRLMPMRKWRQGLHQAIEAKEGLEMSPLDETLARISFQRFFRLFHRLSGMTGTGREAIAEFWHIYRIPVVAIPTNRPCQRRELPDQIFPDLGAKWAAVVAEIERRHQTGQPLLIGTRTVQASEMLATDLRAKGLSFNLLNATRHREEAQIVASAGQIGRITIATNMAGRGTDIKLGARVGEAGGLHVIATERHESHRIDRQLYGRAGRQGDPGSAQAFVSVEDEILARFAAPLIREKARQAVRRGLPGAKPLVATAIIFAQRSAQSMAFRQRKEVLKTDTWLAEALSFVGGRAG